MGQVVERNAIAKRQDLSDELSLADSKKTIFTSMVKKTSGPENTLIEWPVDNMPEPQSDGAVDEADTQDFEDLGSPKAVLQTRLQIWERKPKVSRLAQVAMNQAGVGKKKAFAKAVAKGLVALKRDIEFTVLSGREAAIGTAAVGNQTRGLGKWIQDSAQSTYPVDAAFRTPTAAINTGTAIADMTDDTAIGIMQAMYDQTGDSDMTILGICGSIAKRGWSRLVAYDKVPAGLTLTRQFNNAKGRTVERKVDVLETDFGTVILRLSSFINTDGTVGSHKTDNSKRLTYFVPEEEVSMRFAEEPNSEELPNAGGGPRALISAIGALLVNNPLMFGKHAPTS